ncbi:MAG: hypothetical protein AB1486_23535 [Planctomycetota bacterium]
MPARISSPTLVGLALAAIALSAPVSAQVPIDPHPSEITWVDDDFGPSTPGWGKTCFDTIQGGIDAVAPYGSVHVNPGYYIEQVVVNKSLRLMGVARDTTTVDGRSPTSTGDVIHVAARDVKISGLCIRNSGSSSDDAGSTSVPTGSRFRTI